VLFIYVFFWFLVWPCQLFVRLWYRVSNVLGLSLVSKRFGFWPHITHVIVLTFKKIKHLTDCRTIGLSDYRSDPILFTSSWSVNLSKSILFKSSVNFSWSKFSSKWFPLWRADRNQYGGGVVAYARFDLACDRKMNLEYQTIESICIEININNRKWLISAQTFLTLASWPCVSGVFTPDVDELSREITIRLSWFIDVTFVYWLF
jgi:hypothetical protein